MQKFNLLLFFSCFLFYSCKRDDNFNKPPVIKDSTGQWPISHIDSVGNILHYTWADPYVNNTFWFHEGNESTVTAGTGYTKVDGGNVNFSQYILKLSNQFGAENLTIRQKVVVTLQNANDVGLALGLKNSNQLAGFFAVFHLQKDACYISFHNKENLSNPIAGNQSAAQFKLVVGDTIQLELQRRQNTFNASMINLTRSTSSTLTYTFSLDNTSTSILPALSFYRIYQLGGHYNFIDSILFSYDEPRYPEYAFMGNSVETGYGASSSQKRNTTLLPGGFTKSYVVYAGASERAVDAEARMIDFVQHFKTTKTILFEYGVNDVNGNDNRDSAAARYYRALAYAKSSGMFVVAVSPFPQAKPVQWMIDTMRAICKRLNFAYINDYPFLKNPSGAGCQTSYTTDGVHPNDLGHLQKATIDRMLLQGLGYFLTKDYSIILPAINYNKMGYVSGNSYSVTTTNYALPVKLSDSYSTPTSKRTFIAAGFSMMFGGLTFLSPSP